MTQMTFHSGIICKFIKENTLIFIFFVVSVIIITSYILSINSPALFVGAEHWYSLLFQLSIGYIINFMFYIIQIYIPNSKRDLTVRQCISARLNGIIRDMRSSISSLAQLYLKDHNSDEYKEDELNQLLNLKFSDKVQVLNASRTTRNNFVYFTVREWLSECIRKTEDGIDSLFKYYAGYISVDLMLTLFDDVPGGAGHVKRIAEQDNFMATLRKTFSLVSQCECGGTQGDTSCYQCLRSYTNQYCHDRLKRSYVKEFLQEVLDV